MEFYQNEKLKAAEPIMFQFPTGWNSTLAFLRNLAYRFFVSIPNGMEFYPFFDCVARHFWKFQFPTGWNSTHAAPFRDRSERVSIPNGMEFYGGEPSHQRKNRSFNSQRDGILRSASLACKISFSFQFPTGWNSTLACL